MSTTTDTDHDVLDALDFQPGCEWQTCPTSAACDAEASWLMVTSCGDSATFCQEHKERMEAQIFGLPSGLYCSRHPDSGRLLFDWKRLP